MTEKRLLGLPILAGSLADTVVAPVAIHEGVRGATQRHDRRGWLEEVALGAKLRQNAFVFPDHLIRVLHGPEVEDFALQHRQAAACLQLPFETGDRASRDKWVTV